MRIDPNSVEVWMQENIPLVELSFFDDKGFVDKGIFTIQEVVELSLSTTDQLFYTELVVVKDLMETVGRFWNDEQSLNSYN